MTEINERNLNQMIESDPVTDNEETKISSNINLESESNTIGSSENIKESEHGTVAPDHQNETMVSSNIESNDDSQESAPVSDNVDNDNSSSDISEDISNYAQNENEENNDGWQSLHEFVSSHSDKIENASLANIDGFSRVPDGKYMLFCTDDEENADLILYKKPSSIWIDSSIEPVRIKVQESGLIIKSNNDRVYIGKNNVIRVHIDENNHSTNIESISRSKSSDSVKVNSIDIDRVDTDIDILKLHIKRVSPRLYNRVKDLTQKEEIKNEIFDFMENIKDVNHLIKIEKDLLYARNL